MVGGGSGKGGEAFIGVGRHCKNAGAGREHFEVGRDTHMHITSSLAAEADSMPQLRMSAPYCVTVLAIASAPSSPIPTTSLPALLSSAELEASGVWRYSLVRINRLRMYG